jgi:hypothetical protein
VGVGAPTRHHLIEGKVKERRGDEEGHILIGGDHIAVESDEEGG